MYYVDYAALAQSVEQHSCKVKVVCSNQTSGTINMVDLHKELKEKDYQLYRKAIMYSECICLRLERNLKDDADKIKIFAEIERAIVGVLLETIPV